jgi:hypothetical protein
MKADGAAFATTLLSKLIQAVSRLNMQKAIRNVSSSRFPSLKSW